LTADLQVGLPVELLYQAFPHHWMIIYDKNAFAR
jgi:hypothetical protein